MALKRKHFITIIKTKYVSRNLSTGNPLKKIPVILIVCETRKEKSDDETN